MTNPNGVVASAPYPAAPPLGSAMRLKRALPPSVSHIPFIPRQRVIVAWCDLSLAHPLRGWMFFTHDTQGSRCAATLGSGSQPRWGWEPMMAQRAGEDPMLPSPLIQQQWGRGEGEFDRRPE